ncbi:hypothetical protein BJ322DRAFT_1023822 [Thelephora terrestris]|uniref:Uncharacterized protein n=1 Tax=Thelephora terrestris TaxID=56493 RepID=A0A9P6H6L1_9AGAM|nr:hypothetical protein BJ322DRAFT_1023822 [Thelephora terrestris]
MPRKRRIKSEATGKPNPGPRPSSSQPAQNSRPLPNGPQETDRILQSLTGLIGSTVTISTKLVRNFLRQWSMDASKASFDEEGSTTKLDRSGPEFKECKHETQKIANRIMHWVQDRIGFWGLF